MTTPIFATRVSQLLIRSEFIERIQKELQLIVAYQALGWKSGWPFLAELALVEIKSASV